MKKILNGKSYDTETAVKFPDYFISGAANDFEFVLEKLYKTNSGQWFLCIKAGERAATYKLYEVCLGEGITLMDDNEALQWCEHRDLDTEIIAEHFEIEEG